MHTTLKTVILVNLYNKKNGVIIMSDPLLEYTYFLAPRTRLHSIANKIILQIIMS